MNKIVISRTFQAMFFIVISFISSSIQPQADAEVMVDSEVFGVVPRKAARTKKACRKKGHGKKARNAKKMAVSETACSLRRSMSKLWSDHVFWTRLYIISAVEGSADLTVTMNRLLKNQVDIGSTIAPYYDKKVGDTLTQLLKEQIMIAADVVKAAQSADQQQLKMQDARWHKNADEIAEFLCNVNPANWSEKDLKDMLYNHLTLTTQEIFARLGAQWEQDVQIFDQILLQALDMGQTLANGIIKQFADKF